MGGIWGDGVSRRRSDGPMGGWMMESVAGRKLPVLTRNVESLNLQDAAGAIARGRGRRRELEAGVCSIPPW